jgi:single-strand DNA-binding protein
MTITVTIVGNLTRDPELRFTRARPGHSKLRCRRQPPRWQNRQTQQWEEATSFFDLVAWAGLGENVAQCLRRGDRIVVSGRLDQRSWENNEGGKRSKVEITANEIAPSLRWATVEITKNERRTPETVPAALAPTTKNPFVRRNPQRWRRSKASGASRRASRTTTQPRPTGNLDDPQP